MTTPATLPTLRQAARRASDLNHGTSAKPRHLPYALAPVQYPRPDVVEVAAMMRLLYGTDLGYMEFAYIDGDPRAECKIPKLYPIDLDGRSLMFLQVNGKHPQGFDRAAKLYADLVERFGNVYVSIGLYKHKERAETLERKRLDGTTYQIPNALPRRVVFVDDGTAPAHLPATRDLQSSEHSHQLYYQLAAPVDFPTYRQLEAGLQAACNGPANSKNPLHLVRLVGAVNTKRHGAYVAHFAAHSDRVYTVEELAQIAPVPATSRTSQANTQPVMCDWPQVATELARIDVLLNRAHKSVKKPGATLPRILNGERITFTIDGKPDDSRTMQAAAIGNGLRSIGFPDAEIGAVIWWYYDQCGRLKDKGSEWVQGDIHRLLGDAHAQYPHQKTSPTTGRSTQTAQSITTPTPLAEVARPSKPRGRPAGSQNARIDSLRRFLTQKAVDRLWSGITCEIADALKVSERSARTYLKTLRAAGEITTGQTNGNGRLVIALTPTFQHVSGRKINTQTPSGKRVARANVGVESESAVQGKGTPQTKEINPLCKRGDTPAALPGASVRVLDAVRAALGELANEPLYATRRTVSKRTGEVLGERVVRVPVTIALIVGWIAYHYPNHTWSVDVITGAFVAERRKQQLARKLAQIGVLGLASLKAEFRKAEHLTDKSRDQETNEHRWWSFYASELRRELQRRPGGAVRPSGPCEALPPLRAVPVTLWTEPKPRESAEDAWAAQYRAEYEARQAARDAIRWDVEALPPMHDNHTEGGGGVPPSPTNIRASAVQDAPMATMPAAEGTAAHLIAALFQRRTPTR